MDTLCIPVSTDPGDKEAIELKKRAIDQMATIYGRATQVLVLDSALQELRIGAMQQSEILAQILFSNWMGRSWTLQEGAISPYVYFQFADGALNFFDLPRPSYRRSFFPLHPAKFRHMHVGDDLGSIQWALKDKFRRKPPDRTFKDTKALSTFFYEYLYAKCLQSMHTKAHDGPLNYYHSLNRDFEREDTAWVTRLVNVWNGLIVRTTTMDEDLPAIFANLLGVNTYKVFSLPPQNRLGAILGAGTLLPLSLLWNKGPRLDSNANHRGRWIPEFLGRHALDEAPIMRLDIVGNLDFRFSDIVPWMRPNFFPFKSKSIFRMTASFFRSGGDATASHFFVKITIYWTMRSTIILAFSSNPTAWTGCSTGVVCAFGPFRARIGSLKLFTTALSQRHLPIIFIFPS
jgi:hypothetical protein